MALLAIVLIWAIVYLLLRDLRRRGRLGEDLDRDALAVGLLAALAVGFFWRPLLAGDVYMPADGGDMASFLYPTYKFAATWIRQGVIPLWNPHLYGGETFVGDIQSGILYPIYWLVYLLTPELTYRTLEWMAAGHILIAGANMYLLLRFLRPRPTRLRRAACLAGAVAFMFSDLFLMHFGNLNMIAVAAWLPLVFLFFERSLAGRRPWLAAVAGAVLALATLAGHIQITLFIALVLSLRALWEIGRRRTEVAWAGRLAPAGYLALAGVVALGLTAPVLLPFAEHIGYTQRVAWAYGDTTEFSLAPGQFVSLLIPTLFGRGPALHWGAWDRAEAGYIGVLPLLLAVVALARRRERHVGFLAVLTVLAFVLMMGIYALAHGWMFQFLPGFGLLRAPARFALLFDFGIAGLAAFGLDALLRPLPRMRRRALARLWRPLALGAGGIAVILFAVVYLALLLSQDKDPAIFVRMSVAANGAGLFALFMAGGLALLGGRLSGRLRPATLGILAIGLIFVDLSSAGAYVDLGPADPTARFAESPAVRFLKSEPGIFRIDPRTDIDGLWQPDMALAHGLYDVWGVANPSTMKDVHDWWGSMGSRSSRLYDVLNARYVIARKDVTLDWERFTLAFDGDPDLNVYRNADALPRAWLVHETLPAASRTEAWDLIHGPDFDPGRVAVVEGGPALAGAPAGDSTVTITRLAPNRIELNVEAAGEGLVVLSEVFYPGWRASLNGAPAAIVRTDYLFRGIAVPAGESRIILSYAPATWWIGVGLALLTLAALVASRLWRRLRARKTGLRLVHKPASAP